ASGGRAAWSSVSRPTCVTSHRVFARRVAGYLTTAPTQPPKPAGRGRRALPENPPMPPPALPAAERYFQEALARLHPLLDGQRDVLDRAAGLCTEAIARDGLV